MIFCCIFHGTTCPCSIVSPYTISRSLFMLLHYLYSFAAFPFFCFIRDTIAAYIHWRWKGFIYVDGLHLLVSFVVKAIFIIAFRR